MTSMTARLTRSFFLVCAIGAAIASPGCSSGFTPGAPSATGGATATSTGPGGMGGHGGMGGMGGGGSQPCGGNCMAPTPLCDTSSNKCVACLADGDCNEPANAPNLTPVGAGSLAAAVNVKLDRAARI